MKKFVFTAAALTALAACDMPANDALVLNPAGLERVEALGADAIAPSVSPQTAINTFANFCGRFPANPEGTKRAVEADGYVLFVSGTADGLDLYASPDGRPLIATGRRDGAEVCMAMFQEGRDLAGVVQSYVQQQHGGTAMSLGSMSTPDGVAENVWVVPTQPPVIYFTLLQRQPGIGEIEVIAQVTE